MNTQSANLNIRYDWPVWDYRINVIFSRTEGWIEGTNRWFNLSDEGKYISSSVEPAGLCFYGRMEDDEWQQWLLNIKNVATEVLGVKIGEIELGEVGDDTWHDKGLEVFGEYQKVYKSKNHRIIEEFYTKPKPKLSELDEIEIEKWLFRGEWHRLHDWIASSFQERRHPTTAKFIYDQITNSKIPEFDYKPVTRRLTWALADIGTEEAKEYLLDLANSKDPLLKAFAKKRVTGWGKESTRKFRMIQSSPRHIDRIRLQYYSESEKLLPQSGNCLSVYQFADSIVVYQAYKPAIANYAAENNKFGGANFSFNRMTWIKPNYLWMMYRSGWATKADQERILAIRITNEGWEELLSHATISSFKKEYHKNEEEWKKELSVSEVRLQWDPNHDPYGNKINRKAIQIGIKGEMFAKFNDNMIIEIYDITNFVSKQRIYVEHKQLQHLEIPIETIYEPKRTDLNIGLNLENMEFFQINLNIKYDFPEHIQKQLPQIFAQMDGWLGSGGHGNDVGYWYSFNTDNSEKYISCYHEPSGLHFSAYIDAIEWMEWKQKIKDIASKTLGFKVGEPEVGDCDYDVMDKIRK